MYCPAFDGLYLRANGELACWNSPGELDPVVRLDAGRLEGADLVRDVLNGEAFRRMRRALFEDRDPFDYCRHCTWGLPASDDQWSRADPGDFALRRIHTLQVEPSYQCNLDCPECIPLADRRTTQRPPFHLDRRIFEKLVDDLVLHEVAVEAIQYGGFGEPLMSPDFAHLARYAAEHLRCPSACDTNGNFRFTEALADCGLDWLVLAIDGVSQESYQRYRRRGRLDRVLRFAREACASRDRRGGPRVVWKMVLFEWNSSDEELREACRLAGEIGVDQLRLVNSNMPGGISAGADEARWREIQALVRELQEDCPVPIEIEDPACFAGRGSLCHGYVETIDEEQGELRLTGWLLLEDGPPDLIQASARNGAEARVEPVPRPDLAAAHPSIPRASAGGFCLSLPAEACSRGGDCSLLFRVSRHGVERVRFTLGFPRGTRWLDRTPIEIRHGGDARVD